MLFLVRVRVDVDRLTELARRLASRDLDNGAMRGTYCLARDPAVGVSVWEADDRDDLEKRLTPHRPYYAEVVEIEPVVLPQEAFAMLTSH